MTRRTDTASQAHTDLTHAVNGLPDALRRLMDARPALPGAVSYDGARGGAGGSSSVEALVFANTPKDAKEPTPDPVAAEIRQLDRVLNRLHADALWLARLVDRWTPHAPTSRDLADVARANSEPVPECWLMRRHTDTFEPAHCATTIGGLLDTERHVCRWVYDFARRQGRLPTPEECQRHAAGQTVRVGA